VRNIFSWRSLVLSISSRTPRPIIDSEKRIFAVYAGMPFDDGYMEACARICDFIKTELENNEFHYKEQHHNRGDFVSINFGISQGNGKGEGTRLSEGQHAELIRRMLDHLDIQRIAAFQDGAYLVATNSRFADRLLAAFALWAPLLYEYYWNVMKRLLEHTGETRNFAKSVFACATMNFGPEVCARRHRDMLNLAFGWCAITSLGSFDHTAGGHLVLGEAKLIVEFPAGSTFLIPSSCITHSNTPIGEGEFRASFTQYTAGGVFRWVENGFETDQRMEVRDKKRHAAVMKERKGRWEKGLEKFSTMDQLLEVL